jgi:hypothetical protein
MVVFAFFFTKIDHFFVGYKLQSPIVKITYLLTHLVGYGLLARVIERGRVTPLSYHHVRNHQHPFLKFLAVGYTVTYGIGANLPGGLVDPASHNLVEPF